jgi:hypothetical protein
MSRALHLYTLSRMLAEPEHSFRVGDDLEVFDRNGNLVEAVYVESPEFLTRLRQRLKEHPNASQRLIAYEPIPRAYAGIPASMGGLDGEARAALEQAGFSRKQIDALREVFVTEEVRIDESPGFPQLSAWLAHERGHVSAADVHDRVKVIERASRMDEVSAAKELGRLGIPSVIHVTAQEGWIQRVEELRTIPHVRIAVKADQQAWRRANASGAMLLWKNVDIEVVEPRPEREPRTWSEAAETLHALLHRDVERYQYDNAELIKDVLEATGSIELAWAALDPAGLKIIDVDTVFPEIAKRRPQEAFVDSRAWLSAQNQDAWTDPQWRAVSEVAFWSKRWNLPTHEPDVSQFRRETLTASILDDGETVMGHWIAPVDMDYSVRLEMIKRLDGMRRLFPERSKFGAKIHGKVSGEFAPEEFPSPWLYWVHLLFVQPDMTWDEYAVRVASLRNRVTSLFQRITAALAVWFRRDKVFTIFESGVSAEEWDELVAELAKLPRIPKTADAPEVAYPLHKALHDYAEAVHGFLTTSWRFFVANPQLGRGTPEGRERVEKWLEEEGITRELPTEKLAEAVKRLEALQREFSSRFPELVDDAEERARLWDLWAVWYDFAFYPRRKLQNAVKDSKAAIDARIDERRRALRRRFRELTLAKVEIHSEERGLWITIDSEHAPNVINAFADALVHAIDVLRPPAEQHAFDRYVLDLVWGRVHLVPLVRGKSLQRMQWSLDIATLPQPGEDMQAHAGKFMQRLINDETWEALGLEQWPSNVATAARRLGPAVVAWRDTLDHLVSLREIPEPDPDVLVPHWRDVIEVADRYAEEILELLARLPAGIFGESDDAVETMREFIRSLRALVAGSDAPAFETAEKVRQPVIESLVPAATTIADVWIDRELPT